MADPTRIEFIESRVRELIADHLSKAADQMKPETRIVEDLGADSLDIVELLLRIGDEFDTELDEREAANLVTIGDVSAYVARIASSVACHAGA
jgi:acyl carrier protein